MSLAERARLRPVLYPAGILAAFVLSLLVWTGVSPYAAGRPLLIAVALGLSLPWLIGLVFGDRDRAGIVAFLVVLLILPGPVRDAFILLAGVLGLLLAGVLGLRLVDGRRRGRRPGRIRWRLITRAMSAITAIILVAIVIAAVQNGRITQIARDLVAEAPVGHEAPVARAQTAEAPSVYLVLLDGYPRADKLQDEFGFDNQSFLESLAQRDFVVAQRSRSNYVATDLTLASMLNGGIHSDPGGSTVDTHSLVNDGEILGELRDRGYEVIAFSSGFEGVALRRADRFIDSGQLNEFEWVLLDVSGLNPVLDWLQPTLLADQHRARVLATLDGAKALAREAALGPRFVLVHILGPHSPQAFGPAGEAVEPRGTKVQFDDSDEYELLGPDEYSRRLEGQITYLNGRVLGLVDALIEADPRAVVVVFSDHGSGIREYQDARGTSDTDLRTANLLAVRSPGQASLINDRSTLVNLLPRILRAYTGSGPADVPETIYGQTPDKQLVVFERPD